VNALAAYNARRARPWTITLDEQFQGLAKSRELSARFINASADEIALTPNTSTGLHIAARVLPIESGKIVLGHDGDFPANVYPWMTVERTRGIAFEQVPLRDGFPDHDALLARVARGDVGVVTISWVSFVTGDRADLRRIGEACRTHGAWFVVDAIQGVGVAPLDVRECHIDILSCGAQKWLCAPWGSAFAYVRRELVESLEPHTGGWLSVRHSEDFTKLLDYDPTFFNDARKFEVATIAHQDFIGMNASLEVLLDVGVDAMAQHVRSLTTRLIEGLDAISGVKLLTPRSPDHRAGIVACAADDVNRLAHKLEAANIISSVRGGVLRFSPHVYNTTNEIDRTLEVLEE
jgi:selenocysteine lyase/cysteine desulfurase